jgi:hypothetical protein
VVLERAGDDLRRGRRAAVDENHDGLAGARGTGRGRRRFRDRMRFGGAVTIADRDHRLPGGEEPLAHGDGLAQAPAGIAAHVEDEGARTLRPELLHRRADVGGDGVVEALQRHVADLVAQHDRVRDRRDVDSRPREPHRDRRLHPGPRELDLHLRARLADEPAGDLVEAEAGRREAVHLDDPVTRLHATLGGGRPREGGGDDDGTDLVLDVHADAGIVVPQRVAAEAGDLLRCEELRVGVVDLVDEPTGRPQPYLVTRERVHRAGLDAHADVLEELPAVDETARAQGIQHGGQGEHRGNDPEQLASHGYIRERVAVGRALQFTTPGPAKRLPRHRCGDPETQRAPARAGARFWKG